jgi:hypothetical protein
MKRAKPAPKPKRARRPQVSPRTPLFGSGVVSMCPMAGYLWFVTSDGYIYRFRPGPVVDVLQFWPQPATRAGADDQTFEFRKAYQPT